MNIIYPVISWPELCTWLCNFSSETIFWVPSNILTKAWYVSIVHQFISHKFWDDILPENWRLAPEDNVVMRVKPVTAHDHCLQLWLSLHTQYKGCSKNLYLAKWRITLNMYSSMDWLEKKVMSMLYAIQCSLKKFGIR